MNLNNTKILSKNTVYLESQFCRFYDEIYSLHKVYGAVYDINGWARIMQYDSKHKFLDHIKWGVREQLFFALLIPTLDTIIINEFDYKHIIFVKKKVKRVTFFTEDSRIY